MVAKVSARDRKELDVIIVVMLVAVGLAWMVETRT